MGDWKLQARRLDEKVESSMRLARAHMKERRFDETQSELANVLEEGPENATGRLAMGGILFRQNDCETALGHFQQAFRSIQIMQRP